MSPVERVLVANFQPVLVRFSSENPWVDLSALIEVTLVIFKEVLADSVSFLLGGSGRSTSLEARLTASSTKAFARDEDVGFATALHAAALGNGPVGRVIDRLLDVRFANDCLVLLEVVRLAELMMPTRPHNLIRRDRALSLRSEVVLTNAVSKPDGSWVARVPRDVTMRDISTGHGSANLALRPLIPSDDLLVVVHV